MSDAVHHASDLTQELPAYEVLSADVPGLNAHLEKMRASWRKEVSQKLHDECPYENHERNFEKWRTMENADKLSRPSLKTAVTDYLALCKELGEPENLSYWRKLYEAPERGSGQMAEALRSSFITPDQLENRWHRTLDEARMDWEMKTIAAHRAALLERVRDLLSWLQDLHVAMAALGLETGLFLDFSNGQLSQQDAEEFKRWATYLAQDDGVRALCDLLGKIKQMEESDRIEKAMTTHNIEIPQPDITSKEEIVGIRFGRDLENALPSELALLADPETEILFDLKYLEARLMCFDMQGIQTTKGEAEVEGVVTVSEADKLGPMILCVDTSGSMSGMPETIAKALTLFMASKAREQKRPCYLINFSTNIVTHDLSSEAFGLKALIGFLQTSFHGGTDVAPALEHALEVMSQDKYEKADVLIISDFIMAGLPNSLSQKVASQRARKNRFHSLVVGDQFSTLRQVGLFDQEWLFDPHTSGIHELLHFGGKIHENKSSSKCRSRPQERP